MEQKVIHILPFVHCSRPFDVHDVHFIPLRATIKAEIDRDIWRGIDQRLNIYRAYNGTPIVDGLGVITDGDSQEHAFKTALLCLKYSLITKKSGPREWYDDHFYVDEQFLIASNTESVPMYERGRLSFGTPDTMRRQLPGSLQPMSITRLDLDEVEQLSRLLHSDDNQHVSIALSWFSRAHRWDASPEDGIIRLAVAFEVLFELDAVRDKGTRLGKKLREALLDDRELSKWAKDFYQLRNDLMHDGYVHHDRMNYRNSTAHFQIAQSVFTEAVDKVLKHDWISTSELHQAIHQTFVSSKLLDRLVPKKTALESLVSELERPSDEFDDAKVMALCLQIDTPDSSITSEDCVEYLTTLQRYRTEFRELTISDRRRNVNTALGNVIHSLIHFQHLLRY